MKRLRRTSRRARRIAVAAALALSAGCTTAPKFASGRMPYDGGSEQDPFRATAPSFERTAAADRAAAPAPGPAGPASTAPPAATAATDWSSSPQQPSFRPRADQQAAYAAYPPAAPAGPYAAAPPAGYDQGGYTQPAADPFGEVATSGDAGNPFATAAPVAPAAYQTAAADPFAELNTAAPEPMPAITPAGAAAPVPTGGQWTPRPQATATAASEEFLPPVR